MPLIVLRTISEGISLMVFLLPHSPFLKQSDGNRARMLVLFAPNAVWGVVMSRVFQLALGTREKIVGSGGGGVG